MRRAWPKFWYFDNFVYETALTALELLRSCIFNSCIGKNSELNRYTNIKNYGLHHTRPDHPNCIGWNATTHLRHQSNENIPSQQNNRNKAIATSTIVFALTKSKLNYHLLCTTWTSRKTIFPQWFSYAIHVRKSDKVIDLIHLNEACLAEILILR